MQRALNACAPRLVGEAVEEVHERLEVLYLHFAVIGAILLRAQNLRALVGRLVWRCSEDEFAGPALGEIELFQDLVFVGVARPCSTAR